MSSGDGECLSQTEWVNAELLCPTHSHTQNEGGVGEWAFEPAIRLLRWRVHLCSMWRYVCSVAGTKKHTHTQKCCGYKLECLSLNCYNARCKSCQWIKACLPTLFVLTADIIQNGKNLRADRVECKFCLFFANFIFRFVSRRVGVASLNVGKLVQVFFLLFATLLFLQLCKKPLCHYATSSSCNLSDELI